MTDRKSVSPGESVKVPANSTVVVKMETSGSRWGMGRILLLGLLTASVLLNIALLTDLLLPGPSSKGVRQTLRSGNAAATDKLAVIRFTGTIMPPFTERWLNQIEAATDDKDVKGVLLEIDSPGGFVADSHQLYHALGKLREKKPIFVAMKRMAASGGYYIAMGAGTDGRIFAEPTVWTGSIGVIMPRYDASELATKIGVQSEPFVTGPLKGSLDPFRPLRDDEKEVWEEILDESFVRFVKVITDNRSGLAEEDVRKLATGQVYTADQAIANGLVDEIGYPEDALEALAESLSLTDYKVINYASPTSLIDLVLGVTEQPPTMMDQLLEASVPKALYYCSWGPLVPSRETE